MPNASFFSELAEHSWGRRCHRRDRLAAAEAYHSECRCPPRMYRNSLGHSQESPPLAEHRKKRLVQARLTGNLGPGRSLIPIVKMGYRVQTHARLADNSGRADNLGSRVCAQFVREAGTREARECYMSPATAVARWD